MALRSKFHDAGPRRGFASTRFALRHRVVASTPAAPPRGRRAAIGMGGRSRLQRPTFLLWRVGRSRGASLLWKGDAQQPHRCIDFRALELIPCGHDGAAVRHDALTGPGDRGHRASAGRPYDRRRHGGALSLQGRAWTGLCPINFEQDAGLEWADHLTPHVVSFRHCVGARDPHKVIRNPALLCAFYVHGLGARGWSVHFASEAICAIEAGATRRGSCWLMLAGTRCRSFASGIQRRCLNVSILGATRRGWATVPLLLASPQGVWGFPSVQLATASRRSSSRRASSSALSRCRPGKHYRMWRFGSVSDVTS